MKKILILGAGQSAPTLIKYLLESADTNQWFVTVGDYDLTAARRNLGSHPRGSAIRFDVNDAEMRSSQIRKADIVVYMLPPAFQRLVAIDCVLGRTHMVSASYENTKLRELDADASRHGVLLLNEMGFDPGIDHMAAMECIDRTRSRGGVVRSFKSYGTGLPAPEFTGNPLRYAVTWNPRNVVMSGQMGATYLINDKVKIVPHHQIFQRTWAIDVPGVGKLETYANRDSLVYKKLYGIEQASTMIRGTLRYPGWCDTWSQIVRLGIPNEDMRLPEEVELTCREMVEMFIPAHPGDGTIEGRVAQYLSIEPTGNTMNNLSWLGLFSDDPVPAGVRTPAEALTRLLASKLKLGDGDRDMVVLRHEIVSVFPDDSNRQERLTSTMIEFGEAGGTTAMAKMVGLPVAIATKLILTGQLPLSGCQLPTHPKVWHVVLNELRNLGVEFTEEIQE